MLLNAITPEDCAFVRDMPERVARLEERIGSVLPTLATKADLEVLRADVHKGLGEMKSWMLGAIGTLVLGMLAMGSFIANNA